VAVSEGLKAYLEDRYQRTVYYVPQGVDRPHQRRPELIDSLGLQPRRYIFFMGRLVPEKGLHYLLEAYRRLADGPAGPELPPLIVAGGGAHSDEYVRRVQDSAPPGVRFLGHVEGQLKEELLSHAYLYVQPSEMEGLSLALLEAMSYGNAVLVSDIPENMEAVGEQGVSFRSRDIDDLTGKLAELLRDPTGVRAIGERAREHVLSRYSWDLVAEQLEAVYQRVLTPTGRAAVVEPEGGPAQ
jgi:glycosyltransferase involved in cell wall biosynthesis